MKTFRNTREMAAVALVRLASRVAYFAGGAYAVAEFVDAQDAEFWGEFWGEVPDLRSFGLGLMAHEAEARAEELADR